MVIDWGAFLQVFVAAIVGASIVVTSYALGLRLLVRGGRPPLVTPAEFTDAITVLTEKQRRRGEKAGGEGGAEETAERRAETPLARRRLRLFRGVRVGGARALLLILFNH